ncbi:MAG: NAD(P)H-binding protein [Thermoanaerobaculia bacterium]|nr:NAD(P)H-binding protein [Thermoanaerobaculia bacterium]
MKSRRILLLGATGLVGSELLSLLLAEDSVERVTVVARRASGHSHPKLSEKIFDLTEMDRHAALFAVDQIFCALGTTIKAAGSQERFRTIDHDLPVAAARIGRMRGATHFLLVSSLGADRNSRAFYTRVKGETEDDIIALNYPALTIARPSLLLGPRKERRLGEELAKPFGWLMPKKYRPIEAATVARALTIAAREDRAGVRVLESSEMNSGTKS